MIENTQIQLTELPQPQFCQKAEPVNLTKDTMMWRYQQVCEKMWERGLDVLIVYADREHGGNFAYLTGFVPRFEDVNNGELVPSARSNCTTLPKQEYRLAGWLYRSATAPCRR